MAQFGVPATQMSGADTKAAKFVKQPVADQSSNILLGTALNLASDAYTGYAQASLEKEQEKVIDDYMASKKNPAIAQEAEEDIGALGQASESLWKRVSSEADYQPDVQDFSGIEKTMNEKLMKLKAAKDQGVMSPQEFSDRILATTREAVARNPGLYAELKQHSSRVLEMSGITDVVKADLKQIESAQKQQEKFQDYYLDLGKKHNVPVPFMGDGSVDWGSFVGQIQKIQQQEQLVASAESFGKMDNETAKAQGRAFMQNNGVALMNGKINEVLNKGITLMGAGDFQGGVTQVRLMLNQARQDYTSKLLPIANEPQVKAALEYMDKQMQIVEDTLSKAGSKEDAVKLSENLQKLLRNQQYEDVSKNINPEALKMITSLMSTAGAARIIDQNPQAMGQIMQTLGNVFSGAANGLGTDYSLKLGQDNAVSLGIKNIAVEALKDNRVVSTLEKAISTISQDVQNPEKFKTPADKFNFYEKLVKDLSAPEVKTGLGKLGAASMTQAAGMIDDYMTMTTPAMQQSILKWEKQGVAVTLDVLADGRVIFKTPSIEATRDLNSRYTSRINDSLMALTNLMGTDSKSVAVNHFYPNYLPAWADDKDLQPKNMRPEIDKALKEGRITQEEYNRIIAP